MKMAGRERVVRRANALLLPRSGHTSTAASTAVLACAVLSVCSQERPFVLCQQPEQNLLICVSLLMYIGKKLQCPVVEVCFLNAHCKAKKRGHPSLCCKYVQLLVMSETGPFTQKSHRTSELVNILAQSFPQQTEPSGVVK